jgi:dimethylhistidine N-methyltransferase
MSQAEFLRDVVAGLARPQPAIPGKYLWDEAGSILFDRICDTDDYYPTRHETDLLRGIAGELAGQIGPGATIVEFGSGASHKIRILLDVLPAPRRYLALDISAEFLATATARIAADYPRLDVVPLVADYTRPLVLPDLLRGSPALGFFPGTTIGNFDAGGVVVFLERLRTALAPGWLLIGADPTEDPARLARAYGDADGLMPRLHEHVLVRLRDELGAELEPAGFRHQARVLHDPPHVEAHLVAQGEQCIRIAGQVFRFAPGASIHTDNSYKYAPLLFQDLARRAGWQVAQSWLDPQGLFSLHLLATR